MNTEGDIRNVEYSAENEWSLMNPEGDSEAFDDINQMELAAHMLKQQRRRQRRENFEREKRRQQEGLNRRRETNRTFYNPYEEREKMEREDFREELGRVDESREELSPKEEQILEYMGEKGREVEFEEIEEVSGEKDRTRQLKLTVNLELPELLMLLSSEGVSKRSGDYFRKVVDRASRMIERGVENSTTGEREYPEPEHLELYLRREALKAMMIETPEYGAYVAARKIIEEDGVAVARNFPEIRGAHSDIIKMWWRDDEYDIGDWRDIIHGYESVSRGVRRRNPELSEEELEHRCVVETGRMFVKAGQYGVLDRGDSSPYVGRFREAMAYAQLGESVGERAKKLRRLGWNDMLGLERFIGKSGTSKKLRAYMAERGSIRRKLSEMEDGDDEQRARLLEEENRSEIEKQERWINRERERINHKYDKRISKLESERRKAEEEERRKKELRKAEEDYEHRVEYYNKRTLGELHRDLKKRLEVVEGRIERRKSLADKAIDLMLATGDSSWVNEAGFGLIKKCHRMLYKGLDPKALKCMRRGEYLEREGGDEGDIKILKMGADPGLIRELEQRWGEFTEEELPEICRMTRGNSDEWLRIKVQYSYDNEEEREEVDDSLVREMGERFGVKGLLAIMSRGGELEIAKTIADKMKEDGRDEKSDIMEIAEWSGAGAEFLRKQFRQRRYFETHSFEAAIGEECEMVRRSGKLSSDAFAKLGGLIRWAADNVYCASAISNCIEEASILGENEMLQMRENGVSLSNGLRENGVSLSDGKRKELRRKIQTVLRSNESWLTHNNTIDEEILDYPVNGSEKAQNAWLVEHSFTPMSNEWGKQSIGKIIHTRLTNGVEENLHNATMWLSDFRIPEEGYDIKAIMRDREKGELRELEEYRVKMRDTETEEEFLRMMTSLCSAGLSDEDWKRVRLSNKSQRVKQMFSDPAMAYIYESTFSRMRSGYGFEDFQFLLDRAEKYYRRNLQPGGKMSDGRYKSEEEFRERIQEWIQGRKESSGEVSVQAMNGNFRKLLEMGRHRQDYVDDATGWLTKHMVTPHERMGRAWSDRATALYNGVNDNVNDINEWIKKYDFMQWIDSSPWMLESGGLTREELFGEYDGFVTELTRCYGNETTLRTIEKYKNIHNESKICPAEERRLKHGKREFSGVVLAHDDPRGMTIGYDTGCCMTVDGASWSCIESGYRDENAGFFALYEASGQIMAQSYFYTNPDEDPEVLVMDNIESNAGRDANVIVDLYQDYFRQYLLQRFREDPDWRVREVHIGTQYGELVKPIVERLPQTKVVLNPNEYIYTDAAGNQVLLFRLTNDEIAQAREEGERMGMESEQAEARAVEKVLPTHEARTVYTELTENQAEVMKALEERLYPPEMRQYGDADFLSSEVTMEGAERYSFVINSQVDAEREPVGYCLAYRSESEVEPGKDSLYIADFGILRERRTLTGALSGFFELLRRAEEDGVEMIEMDARDATSYRLLMSEGGQRIFGRRGWNIEDTGVSEEFSEEEETHLLVMRRVGER